MLQGKIFLASCFRQFADFRKPEGLLPSYQKTTLGLCHEQSTSYLLSATDFANIHFNVRMWGPEGGPGERSSYSNSLRAGRYGDRIPLGSENFRTRPYRSWGPPSLLYNGYRLFCGGKRPGRGVDHPPPIKRRAILLLHLWAFAVCYRWNLRGGGGGGQNSAHLMFKYADISVEVHVVALFFYTGRMMDRQRNGLSEPVLSRGRRLA
jgi:hypothetical protein